ncbi:MAG: LytTR family DNA-binding domain-containing protein [Gemmatimonadaceae bacterium]|nr:LytTR family DNA-binding domain-containing protein [Gemmatimonadaceae bacterium]
MRVLVVDDEEPARTRLRRLVAGIADVTVVDEAADGEAAVRRIAAAPVDVVLLDIRMPKLDGFGVVDALGDAMPLAIFCTASTDHAIRAFDAQAVDYLLKPVDPARLARALERARLLLAGPAAPLRRGVRAAAAVVESRGERLHRVLVHDEHRALLLPVDQIDLIRADRNYCIVRAGGRTYRVRRTVQMFEARLDPAHFLRANRSDIVRLDAVREIQPWSHGDYRLVMTDGTIVPWSRRYRAGHPAE